MWAAQQDPARQGKSDPIDAQLAVLTALQIDGASCLGSAPTAIERPCASCCARQELTTAATAQTNRLRDLLRDGDDYDLDLARGSFSDAVLARLAAAARCRPRPGGALGRHPPARGGAARAPRR